MTLSQRVSTEGMTPDVSRPDPARVVRGDPVHTTWNLEDRGGLYAGLWQSTPGAWRVSYSEWEYFHILKGQSVLTGDDGTVHVLKAGDALIKMIIRTANGRLTAAEALGHREFVFTKLYRSA